MVKTKLQGNRAVLVDSALPQLMKARRLKEDLPASEVIEVTVFVRPDPKQGWQELMDRHGRSASTLRHEPAVQSELHSAFAADPAETDRVASVLEGLGLEIAGKDPAKRQVQVRGTKAALEQVFQVELHRYHRNSIRFRGYDGEISVPAEIGSLVELVVGLDDYPVFRRPVIKASTNKFPPAKYTVPEVAAMYAFPQTRGAGQTVGIIAPLGGYNEADIDQYFSRIGLPRPAIVNVGNNKPTSLAIMRQLVAENTTEGCPPQQDAAASAGQPSLDELRARAEKDADAQSDLDFASWTLEITMDVQLLGSFANQAQIVVYFLTGFDLRSLILSLIDLLLGTDLKPSILAASWGFEEEIAPAAVFQFLDEYVFGPLAVMGITVCAAAGDSGSTPVPKKGPGVLYPASSPWVLSCGGTTLEGSGGAITSETVWNSWTGATGGGVSKVFRSTPSWQKRANTGLTGRALPDVAAVADGLTGCLLIIGGCNFVSNGTSASAPLWAGLLACLAADLGLPLGFATPLFYQSPVSSTFNDITQGNNIVRDGITQYSARKGWDPCSGWGSPNGVRLAAALNSLLTGGGNTIPEASPELYFVDTGTHSRERVHLLRKGRGRILQHIRETVESLGEAGDLGEESNVVAIVVQKESGWRS